MVKKQGLAIVYTGDGKGKTTAALGLALRAAGQGMKILIVQFMKNAPYGEHQSLKKLSNIHIKVFGKGFCKMCGDQLPLHEHTKAAQTALTYTYKILKKKQYDLIILDEINCALQCKLLTVASCMKLFTQKPSSVHLVFTGRGAPRSFIKKADLVSEVKNIKHPFDKGMPAQKGIEF